MSLQATVKKFDAKVMQGLAMLREGCTKLRLAKKPTDRYRPALNPARILATRATVRGTKGTASERPSPGPALEEAYGEQAFR